MDALVERLGGEVRLALPLGLGKPALLTNALYRRARSDPRISLDLFTALTLEPPRGRSPLEWRLLGGLSDRLFGRVPELGYASDLRAGRLPSNVRVHEFYLRPGAYLDVATAQRQYVSCNYSSAARDLASRGINLIAQMVAPGQGRPSGRYSLSCNPDLTADLVDAIQAVGGAAPLVVGEVNPSLPYMHGDAEVDAGFFDLLLESGRLQYDLFPVPNHPVSWAEHAIGLRVATRVRDGGTLQIGIGSVGEAIAYALALRRRDSTTFLKLASAIGATGSGAELDDLPKGLYGMSEMLVEGFLHLRDHGVLRRTVSDGAFLHAGFYLGSAAFYRRLRSLEDAERRGIRMSRISFTNSLFGAELQKRRERCDAHFVNATMMATLLGAAVSDGLESGSVVSGVGGQHDFVCMAHALAGGRSMLVLPATRASRGKVTSNIVWSHGHVTIPRHLRDMFVTEYGVAELRGRSDEQVIAAMLEISDSRFQETLRRQAVAAGKLSPRYSVAPRFRCNVPERLERELAVNGGRAALPHFPLGSDFSQDEAALVVALGHLDRQRHSLRGLAQTAALGWRKRQAAGLSSALERLGLARPERWRDHVDRLLVAGALASELGDEGRSLFVASARSPS